MGKAAILLFLLIQLTHFDSARAQQSGDLCAKAAASKPQNDGVLVEQGHLLLTTNFKIFWKGKEVNHCGRKKACGDTRWRFLLALTDHPNQRRPLDELIEEVWPGEEPTEVDVQNNLGQHANRLRKFFREVDPTFDAIKRIDGDWVWIEGDPKREKFGDLEYVKATGDTFWKEHSVKLSHSELRIVIQLIENEGKPVAIHKLYNSYLGKLPRVMDPGPGLDNLVAVEIRRIRRAFRAVDAEFSEIETITGKGYRWIPRS